MRHMENHPLKETHNHYNNLPDCVWNITLGVAQRRRPHLPEIVLWTTASRHPSESQTSECSDLLSRSRATFVIVAQRQPGKLNSFLRRLVFHVFCWNNVDETNPPRNALKEWPTFAFLMLRLRYIGNLTSIHCALYIYIYIYIHAHTYLYKDV